MDKQNNNLSYPPKKDRSALVGIFVVLLAFLLICFCFIAFIVLIFGLIGSSDISINEEIVSSGNLDEKIVVINVEGTITSLPESSIFEETQLDMTSNLISKLERAKKDEDVKAVILEIDSPGGEVYASELIYNKILELKEEDKKVVSLFKSTAASGAYYIAAPSDHIVASETTITGSIGVRIQTLDVEGLYEKLGIKTYDIVNSEGDFKILTNDLDNPESEAYEVLESILDDVYDQFVDVIVEGRGLSRNEVIELADGRVYSGKAAVDLKLVDSLGYYNDAVEEAKTIAGLESPQIIEYKDTDPYITGLGLQLKKQLNEIISLVPNEEKVETKLLYILSL